MRYRALLGAQALTLAALAASPLSAQTSLTASNDLVFRGYVSATGESIKVPDDVIKTAKQVYDLYDQRWNVPRIDVTTNGQPTIFYLQRSSDEIKQSPNTGARTANAYPFSIDNQSGGVRQMLACSEAPLERKVGWCSADHFSIGLLADRSTDWALPMLISHEFLHLRIREFQPREIVDKVFPYWISEGSSNGFGFGFVEHLPGLSRRAIAEKTAGLPSDQNQFSAFLGLRYYDRPLPLTGEFALTYPRNHPAYPAKAGEPDFHVQMAGYGTGSFFRHALRGRPRGTAVMEAVMKRPMPRTTTGWGPWIHWLDEGLKTARLLGQFSNDGKPTKVWPRGIRQVYAEMIADMADFPDRVAKSRKGRLSADQYDKLLWSKGCETIDLAYQPYWSKTIDIAPIAARCLRIKMPAHSLDLSGKDAKLLANNLPPSFVVTATASDGGCNDLEVGTRGEVLSELIRFKGTKDAGKCIAKWLGYYLPLNVNDPQGLKGYQTIVISNVADEARLSKPRQIELSIVNPVASGSVDAAQTVERGGGKIKKPVPKPKRGRPREPQVGVPVMVEPEPPVECDADQRAIFECGDTMTILFNYGDGADVAVDMEAVRTMIGIDQLPAAFSPDGEDSIASVIQASKGDGLAGSAGAMTKLMSGGGEGGGVSIQMQRLASGQTGTFPAQVKINWASPGGFEGSIASIAPARLARAGDCVVVQSFRATGTVTVTRNSAGLLMGTVRAEFLEENPDDRAACQTPYVRTGTAEFAFSLGGIVTVGDLGDYDIDMDQMQKASEARLANAMAVGTPMGDRMEGDGARPGMDGDQGNPEQPSSPAPSILLSGAPDDPAIEACMTTVTRRDLDQALRKLYGELATQNPEFVRQLREQYLADWENTKRLLCLWQTTGAVP
ncbi:hypothetical protein ACPVPU_03390 [Sphingomonas sp. CJ99]